MSSIILRTTGRFVLPAALLFSLYVLLRGHNEPGGGFIGGLIAAAGLTVHGLAQGRASLLSLLRVSPKAIIGAGLAPALVSGLPARPLAQPYLTTNGAPSSASRSARRSSSTSASTSSSSAPS
jgi:multicomponent Na+:H+ antiporter subunit B